MTLLEVIVAMTILALAGAALVTLTTAASHALHAARASDQRLSSANAFFAVVTLWPREDLDRHLGERSEGPWRLRIQRGSEYVYAVALIDTATGKPMLQTRLYRAPVQSPEAVNVSP